jgi:hypothetical protein
MKRSSSAPLEAVVRQPDTGASFTTVLDDVARRSEMLWEASVAHGASERFWPRLFRVEVVSLVIVMAFAVRVPHAALGCRVVVLHAVLMMHLGF